MNSTKQRKIVATIGLLLLALVTWIGKTEQVLGLIGYDAVQEDAHAYLLDVRRRALEVFLAARTADGLIALMESVQVGPVVAEARPGAVLEPVREVMDHLGNMMGVSVISVEALDILRRVGVRISFGSIIPLGLVILAAAPWLVVGRFSPRPVGQGILLVGIVLTIALPLAVCAEKYIFHSVVDTEYGAAYQDVSHIKTDLDARLTGTAVPGAEDMPPPALDPAPLAEAPSLLSRMEAWFASAFPRLKEGGSAVRAVTEQGTISAITDWLNAKVESALTLMAIFLVEVFVLPSLLGYALYQGFRSMIAGLFSPFRTLQRGGDGREERFAGK